MLHNVPVLAGPGTNVETPKTRKQNRRKVTACRVVPVATDMAEVGHFGLHVLLLHVVDQVA